MAGQQYRTVGDHKRVVWGRSECECGAKAASDSQLAIVKCYDEVGHGLGEKGWAAVHSTLRAPQPKGGLFGEDA